MPQTVKMYCLNVGAIIRQICVCSMCGEKNSWFKNNICASWNKRAGRKIWIASGIVTNKCVHFIVVCKDSLPSLLVFHANSFNFVVCCWWRWLYNGIEVRTFRWYVAPHPHINIPVENHRGKSSKFLRIFHFKWNHLGCIEIVWCWSANWRWCGLCVYE